DRIVCHAHRRSPEYEDRTKSSARSAGRNPDSSFAVVAVYARRARQQSRRRARSRSRPLLKRFSTAFNLRHPERPSLSKFLKYMDEWLAKPARGRRRRLRRSTLRARRATLASRLEHQVQVENRSVVSAPATP